MLLTLKQPPNHHGFNKSFHEYAPPTPPSTTSRYSPSLSSAGSTYPPPPAATVRKLSADQPMSTPHRGLPPPAAMTLPPPQSSSQIREPIRESTALVQTSGGLPPAPDRWVGSEEHMRDWLHAKAEVEKKGQEEEKTKQEALRLEQRRIEESMLNTSLRGGIPPYMIPMVFAGMGGGNLPHQSVDFAERFMAQAQRLHDQQLQIQQQSITRPGSPSFRREERTMSHAYPPSHHPIAATLPSSVPARAAGSSSVFAAGYNIGSPNSRQRPLQGPSHLGHASQTTQLPRLNTGEMQIHPPPQAPPQTLPGQPLQSQTSQEQETGQSSELYFHHWVPPASQAAGSGSNQATPNEQAANSPKKRKAEGPQRPAPPPTSQPQYHSPQYSQAGSSQSGPSGTPGRRQRGHSRSERGSLDYPRANRRHHHNDSENNSQIGISPDQQGFMPPQDGPISSRRNTLQMPRDDRNDPRQQPIHIQHHQQHQHQYQSQPPLQSQPAHPHHQQQSQYNDRNIYQSGPDLRRDTGRGGERSPDQDREMSSRLHSIKRDERE